MSGIRHHILPRFLLKGFASRKEKQNYFAWVFRHEAVPFEANIDKIAVSKKFYDSNVLDVDLEITDAETELGEYVNTLRRITYNTRLDVGLLPNLLTHLELRTRHLRESLLDVTNLLSDEIVHLLNDKSTIKRLVLNKIKREPNLLYEQIYERFEVNKFPPALRNLFANFVFLKSQQILESQQFSKEIDRGLSIIADTFAREATVRLPQAIKNGHIEGLKRGLFSNIQVDRYRELKFRLVVLKKGFLILGDSAIIIESEPGTKYKPHLEANDKIKSIYLPISKFQLIAGQKDGDNSTININKILALIAKCSREFFVSSDNTLEKQKFAKSIGKNAQLLSKQEVLMIVSKWIEKEFVKK